MKKIFSLFAAVLFAGSMMADSYVKVTEAPADWAGQYLIVYEGDKTHDAVAFNGGLTTLDAANNGVAVTIVNGEIAGSEALTDAEFTIAAVTGGYSIKAANGKFIGATSYANSLATSDEAIVNSLDGLVPAVVLTGGTVTMKYNYADNQKRFRYYKSGQQTVALYKLVAAPSTTPTIKAVPATLNLGAWEQAEGQYSEVQKVTIKGENLTGEIALSFMGALFSVTPNRLTPDAEGKINAEVDVKVALGWIENAESDLHVSSLAETPDFEEKTILTASAKIVAKVTNCATARVAALSTTGNNVPFGGAEKTYKIRGYVTEIADEYNSTYHNISFWLADTKDGGQVIEAFRAACATEADAPAVGDAVEITGQLGQYNGTPQFLAGATYVVLPDGPTTSIDNTVDANKAEKFFRDGQLIIRKNGVEYNAQGAVVR